MKAGREHPLCSARCQRNLTINQLAEAAKVGASTIWRAEHSYPISAESRRRLCQFFHLTALELGLVSDCREKSHDRSAGAIPAQRDTQKGVTGDIHEMLVSQVISSATSEAFSLEERTRLCNGLRQSVMESWQLYQTAPPALVLVVAQTQLALVRQVDSLLPADLRSSLYAALYNLMGAALLHLGQYNAAQKMHQKAHLAALEAADIWNMAQSLNWQAICANNMGQYEAAIECIEAALRLLARGSGEAYVRLEAHLFADGAFNAALLQEQSNVQEKLERSAALLEGLGSDEEFDLSRWHQTAGRCMLLSKQYPSAIAHLERSVAELPSQWLMRQMLALMPLAEAYARQRERDASLATGERIAASLQKLDSALLNHRFIEVQGQILKAFPQDQQVRAFIERAQHQPLLPAPRANQPRASIGQA